MGLEGSLDVSTSGRTATFTFTVENTGDTPVSMQFRSGQTFDLVVESEAGEVWRWSDGMMFTQMLQSQAVDPGELMRETATWENADPGDYEARAWITATDVDCEARTSFSI